MDMDPYDALAGFLLKWVWDPLRQNILSPFLDFCGWGIVFSAPLLIAIFLFSRNRTPLHFLVALGLGFLTEVLLLVCKN